MTAETDPDKIKLLAHKATRSAQARFGSLDLTERDYWDQRIHIRTACRAAMRRGIRRSVVLVCHNLTLLFAMELRGNWIPSAT